MLETTVSITHTHTHTHTYIKNTPGIIEPAPWHQLPGDSLTLRWMHRHTQTQTRTCASSMLTSSKHPRRSVRTDGDTSTSHHSEAFKEATTEKAFVRINCSTCRSQRSFNVFSAKPHVSSNKCQYLKGFSTDFPHSFLVFLSGGSVFSISFPVFSFWP